MKSPKFWYKSKHLTLGMVLYPLSLVYSFFASLNYKSRYRSSESEARVIAVGGITVGGSGKTPAVIALCDFFKDNHKNAAVLTRGFGRDSSETLMVDLDKHTFRDVGDEALLIAEYANVFVGKNRAKSARNAVACGHDLIILDDGLTQRYIKPDVRLAVIDNKQRFGNGYMLPLGPNRINFNMIKDDVDAVIIMKGLQNEDITKVTSQIPASIPILTAYLEQDFSQVKSNERIIAFAGLGYPKKFFQSLQTRMNLVKTVEFPDHHPYTDKNIADLLEEANLKRTKLLTTKKDLTRIPKKYHESIKTIPMKVIFDDIDKLRSIIEINE